MPDLRDDIVRTARACRNAQKRFFKMRAYQRGPGGMKVTRGMIDEALQDAKTFERTLDTLIEKYDEGPPLLENKDD